MGQTEPLITPAPYPNWTCQDVPAEWGRAQPGPLGSLLITVWGGGIRDKAKGYVHPRVPTVTPPFLLLFGKHDIFPQIFVFGEQQKVIKSLHCQQM